MLEFFNYKDLGGFIKKALFPSKHRPRHTPKSVVALVVTTLIFIPLEIINHVSLFLDRILFPNFKYQKIKEPIFIIGFPRSGTTFLQRLMAKDTKNITTMRTWEILGAPSIIQKKIIKTISKFLSNFIDKKDTNAEMFSEIVGHKLAVKEAEEDQFLFLHIWSTLGIWTTTGLLGQEAEKYVYFEEKVSPKEKSNIMNFYKACIKRHLYTFKEKGEFYLSKNPSATPKIKTLLKEFPDARFIYLVREPKEAISSYVSFTNNIWKSLGIRGRQIREQNFILGMADYWYEYPFKSLKEVPEKNKMIINFSDLVKNPKQTIEQMYNKFGLEVTEEFQKILEFENERSKKYKSKHKYSMEKMNISEKTINGNILRAYKNYLK